MPFFNFNRSGTPKACTTMLGAPKLHQKCIPERSKLKIKHSEIIFFKILMKKLNSTCFLPQSIVFSKNNCLEVDFSIL